jgi:hypothetical protein
MEHRRLPSVFSSPVLRRTLAALPLVLAASLASAQQQQQSPAAFPLDAVGYLNEELPRMEAAVAARDRSFFHGAIARTVEFSERWGFKVTANPDLAPYATCTSAVMDYTVVGMCRLMPNDDACEPGLASRFEAELQRCRDIAAAKK